MKLLLDTSVLIAAQRGVVDLFAWIRGFQAVEVPSAAIAEYLVGVYSVESDRKRDASLRFYREAILAFTVRDFDQEAAEVHARMVAETRRSGVTMQVFDSIIAATAVAAGYGVGTLDVHDFRRAGVTVHTPPKRKAPDPSPDPGPSET